MNKILLVRHKKSWAAKLIRKITGSRYDHVALLIDGAVMENDLDTDVNIFREYWLDSDEGKRLWEYEVIDLPANVTTKHFSVYELDEYSIGHNIKALLYRFKPFKRFIKTKSGKSNCVGYVAKMLGLEDEEWAFYYPEEFVDMLRFKTRSGELKWD
jgi:hypothetical protein